MLYFLLILLFNISLNGCNAIIDGYVVTNEDNISYAAYIKVLINEATTSTCSGSIIDKEFILTSAHCFFRKRSDELISKDVRVIVGLKNIEEARRFPENEKRVTEIVVLKSFDNTKETLVHDAQHDIAILRLQEELVFQDNRMSKVELPENPITGEINATIAGFGRNKIRVGFNDHKYFPDVRYSLYDIQLRKSVVNTIYFDDNDKKQDKCMFHGRVQRDENDKPVGVCDIDSGSPLVYTEGETQTIVGILSAGSLRCNDYCSESPPKYTKISTECHTDFIKYILGKKYSDKDKESKIKIHPLIKKETLRAEKYCA